MHELQEMKKQQVNSFFIIDQLFTNNRDFVMELCTQMIKENFSFSWSCQTRVDQIDSELVQVMKRAGCQGIWIGVENVTDEVLAINQKGTSRSQILKCMEIVKAADINFNMFFMLGMPGETRESLTELYNFIATHKFPCTKSFMVCTPRYGTEMYLMVEKEHPRIAEDFCRLNEFKGQVNNDVTLEDIQETISRLSALYDRNN